MCFASVRIVLFEVGATKTILFSFATVDTAGASAEVSVPARKSTLSLMISSRARRTASSAFALLSRATSSSLRPSTPPLALMSATASSAPLVTGTPYTAAGPDNGIGQPILIVSAALATAGSRAAAMASARQWRRYMRLFPSKFVPVAHRAAVLGRDDRWRHRRRQPGRLVK